MDFKKALEKFKEKTSPYVEKVKPYTKKAKEYGVEGLRFATGQIAQSPLFLRDEEAANIHASSKRSILVAFDDSDKKIQELLILFPVWSTKAWMDAADLKFLSIRETPDLARTLKIEGPLELRVLYNGSEFLKSNSLDDIKAWWDKRCYTPVETSQEREKTNTDPLSQA